MEKVIRRALISVYHKDGLAEIVRHLHSLDVEIVSTGGTKTFIDELGIPCVSVEELTDYPSLLGGRVKTLHPAVFGGILARRDEPNDLDQVATYGLALFDLVVVDLYPFRETVLSGGTPDEIIEKIDIGGISLIRAAAKNHSDVLIVSNRGQYVSLLNILKEGHGVTTYAERRRFALEAFATSSEYDTDIFNYFDGGDLSSLRIAADTAKVLRYGENPHQRGLFFGDFYKYFDKLQGKDISYNNLLDLSAAVSLIAEFRVPTFAVLKHNNPCGVASRDTLEEACRLALACDPESAFGGVLAANRTIDVATAQLLEGLFFEVLVAPDYDSEAVALLAKKSKRILLVQKELPQQQWSMRSLLGGMLVQEQDMLTEGVADMDFITEKKPVEDELQDLVFANIVAKHCKSNAVALVKDSCLCASGVGQTSRVAALRQAIEKAKGFGFDLSGAVLGSDAFFPFSDCVELAAAEGVSAIIQPGGSIRDQESIDACNRLGISMVLTGNRHFRH